MLGFRLDGLTFFTELEVNFRVVGGVPDFFPVEKAGRSVVLAERHFLPTKSLFRTVCDGRTWAVLGGQGEIWGETLKRTG